jgi:hypothetical protein
MDIRESSMKKNYLISFALLTALTGCTSTQEKPIEEQTQVNDFPTRDRVEYVLNCVAKHGGLSYITQYACGCKVDKIAEKLTFEEYEAAQTISYLRRMPGESGGVFRDPAKAKDLRKRLIEAEEYAEKNCFVK